MVVEVVVGRAGVSLVFVFVLVWCVVVSVRTCISSSLVMVEGEERSRDAEVVLWKFKVNVVRVTAYMMLGTYVLASPIFEGG